jgi:predicted NUDIX family NTP pyrophosphohydrolase
MAAKQSAGLLVYKIVDKTCQVLLLHPGGPLYAKKDFWSIPKGELEQDEDHLAAAYREFEEEVGVELPDVEPIELGSSKQKSGKVDYIWAIAADITVGELPHDTFTMEWPPRSGRIQEFVENDRAAWFTAAQAKDKVFASQRVFFDRLMERLQVENPEIQAGKPTEDDDMQPSLF